MTQGREPEAGGAEGGEPGAAPTLARNAQSASSDDDDDWPPRKVLYLLRDSSAVDACELHRGGYCTRACELADGNCARAVRVQASSG